MMNPQLHLEPPPQDFLSPLLELRDYYAGLVEEYESLYTQARSQLDHVQALLSSWSSDSDPKNQIPAVKVTPQLSPSPQDDSVLSTSDSASFSQIDASELRQSDIESADSLEIEDSATTVIDTDEPSTPDLSEITPETIKGVDIPMLPQYQSLSRMDAIARLLREHIGVVCHIDFIVRSLYGELEPFVFKVVKGRVQSSLTQGRERQAWFGIPDEPGCYTLDLSLVTSNRTHRYSQHGRSKKKKSVVVPSTNVIPMLEAYEGQFLIDALTVFFKQNPGTVFSVAEVITGLYGELDEEEVKEVKSKVLNELSRGYRIGRFARIPNKVGFYTLDLKLAAKSG
ncbi:hypothetical protein Nos7524_0582 [Nostoc sp. PCC 7524]|uniref:hypothetical protein n=1 Tax=Nostoc sp. (strain ATCC 29411 / PCC 7524) TaxID=28072 RepID=UPI00029F2725|nr:hypothetical protein [Nostoc sp. PCC 7524]AFY46493.1 hypothetical protein Nos7524_0582 [Nostoc sp. PCC 7524]